MVGIKVTTYIEPSSQTGGFTFSLGQEVSGVKFNSGTAASATIPLDTSVAFPVGVQIPIVGIGAGQLTVSPASGVTLISADNKRKLRVTGSGATLWQVALNYWVLLGDLAA